MSFSFPVYATDKAIRIAEFMLRHLFMVLVGGPKVYKNVHCLISLASRL
jgi:hypothetical protein